MSALRSKADVRVGLQLSVTSGNAAASNNLKAQAFGKDVGCRDILSRRNRLCCAQMQFRRRWVTRASSRVEFIESEFNGTGARSPYIQYQVSASDAARR
jgi:hypothetical protein